MQSECDHLQGFPDHLNKLGMIREVKIPYKSKQCVDCFELLY